MDTSKLKKFAQYARRSLIEQVQSKFRLVLAQDSAARREYPHAVKELQAKQKEFGDDQQLIEQVAYTWFNRFCALRFMDVNQYNRIMVVSPIAGQFQPEILAEAKAGHLDDTVFDAKTSDKIRDLLSGAIPSRDGQAEAYRLIIVAMCNAYHRLMPYLFERIEDYTELLMPEDLLSGNSILAYTREAMTPENCKSVESIGWLYQFYISEKKDQVFEGLKKNKKITAENIPAATQLFTPHWIVRYLVENSLGRLWMLNNPSSKVIEQMKYYIKPAPAVNGEEQEEPDFLKISSPEELKICDPAAGSGHMLTYAYDLLYAIYLDANYDPVDIPELILTKNLYGIEIDERAAELAAFALSMKAIKGNPFDDSNNRRRFFRNPIKPNICRLEKVVIDDDALQEYIGSVGRDSFTTDVIATLKEFEEADNFGSLIQPTLKSTDKITMYLNAENVSKHLFISDTHKSVLKILKQAEYLSKRYHVVVANPPYMGSKGMNSKLSDWAKLNYPDSKSDLFSMFIERNLNLVLESGFSAMINMQSWMFLSTYERLRKKLIERTTINSMAHLGTRAFDSIGGEVVSTTAFILENIARNKKKGSYIRLIDGKSEESKKVGLLSAINNSHTGSLYRASNDDFKKIPGSPIAYWVSNKFRESFVSFKPLSEFFFSDGLTKTGDNNKYLRFHWEVDRASALDNDKYRICVKGGESRDYFGNIDVVVNWSPEVREHYRKDSVARITPEYLWQALGISWTKISARGPTFRSFSDGMIAETGGPAIFVREDVDESIYWQALGFLSSRVSWEILTTLNPTLNFQTNDVLALPFNAVDSSEASSITKRLTDIAVSDWNTYENAWEFKTSPLIGASSCSIANAYEEIRIIWNERIQQTMELKKANNDIFINAYNLNGEISGEVEFKDITLICNPYFRYSESKTEKELESLLLADTICEFISYSVGCIFGRYSLDQEGIILANQADTMIDYLRLIPSPSFVPDEDNVIPIIDFDGDWFEDDISERFKEFLKVTFGEESFTENLAFIEEAIGKDIKKYFVKDFYADHVKRYKKRPIYWLFSSPKGSFNALIYMHRYQPDTVSIVLNDYLREFRTKLEARKESYEQVEISASASQKDKTNAIKAIGKINKVLDEINDYEHDVLYPLAGEKIEIDLDDGVKHNYQLFGKALKKVPGLS
ncbi:BREX-1 system adenine-specific DNA-methyltransferase PglX [Alteromonas gracilis]|uniref:BREX-1 system adenine-specific DNA-methyltransferase PglX n=1 Tax=Alteromonas gracilis TaxID=1479524 RepID=UPI002FE2A884